MTRIINRLALALWLSQKKNLQEGYFMKSIMNKIEKRIWSKLKHIEVAQNCYSVAEIRTLYHTSPVYNLLTLIWAVLYNLIALW